MNTRSEQWLVAVLALTGAILLLTTVGVAQQAEEDHLLGYKIKDLDKIKPGTTHLITNQFVTEAGCEVKGKAKFFMVPSSKDGGNDARGGPAGHFVCYKVKCSGALPPTTRVDDQLAEHELEPKKAKILCVPADKYVCGDGDIDPGEECDGTDDQLCPGNCTQSCTCPETLCPLSGDSTACLGWANITPCGLCCDADTECESECSFAAQFICADSGQNDSCSAAVNAADCGSVCCP